MSLPYAPYDMPSTQVTALNDWSDGTGIFFSETKPQIVQQPRLIRQYASYLDESDGWGTILPIRPNLKDGNKGHCLQKPGSCPVPHLGWCDFQRMHR